VLRHLDAAVDDGSTPTLFVPIAFFQGRGPRPIPGRSALPIDFNLFPLGDLWLILVYLIHRKDLIISFGEISSSDNFSSSPSLYRQLALSLYHVEKLIRGAKQHSSRKVEAIVLSGNRFEKAVLQTSVEQSLSRREVLRQARSDFAEISATMRGSTLKALYYLMRPIISTLFQKIEVRNIERLREVTKGHPTVLLPNHRSHFDYLLISWVMYHCQLPLPYVAAGINLNFWPAGAFIKAAGGFFIRRRIGNDRMYKAVLDGYLRYLIKHSHLLAFYIEGGRSRSGAMRIPKLGLLKYLLSSWQSGAREDVYLVPMGITYERIAEEDALLREESGATKKSESVRDLVRAKGLWRRRHGTVILEVGDPISLRDFRDETQTNHLAEGTDLHRLTEDIGFSVCRNIMQHTVVTGPSLLAIAFASFPEDRVSAAAVRQRMLDVLASIFLHHGDGDSMKWGLETELSEISNFESRMEALRIGGRLEYLLATMPIAGAFREIQAGMISSGYLQGSSEGDLFVSESQLLRLDYYKNSILHHVALPAMLSLLAKQRERSSREVEDHLRIDESDVQSSFELDSLRSMYDVFRNAYLFPPWPLFLAQVRERIASFDSFGWFAESVVSPGEVKDIFQRKLSTDGRRQLGFLPVLIAPVFEALNVLLRFLLDAEKNQWTMSELREEFAAYLGDEIISTKLEATTKSMVDYAIDVLIQLDLLQEHSREATTGAALYVLAVDSPRLEQIKVWVKGHLAVCYLHDSSE
jgi:glycerol-3-phosphate O-acyltransferase